MRVKVFTNEIKEDNVDSLEKQMNDWFDLNPEIVPSQILQSSGWNYSFGQLDTMVSIFY